MNSDDLLAGFPVSIHEIAERLRECLLELIPGAIESVDRENIGLGVGKGYKGLAFVITPRPGYVMLGIAGGASLNDPTGLLQGKGKVHRHVKLFQSSELENPALEELIRCAAAEALKGASANGGL